LKRFPLAVLLVIQALGGGAITLAHARDIVAAPPGVEASHDARCAILHDEMRCALCHYASARVVSPPAFTIVAPAEIVRFTPIEPVVSVAVITRLTTPARAPPLLWS
ncbi:MAG TPA: hypothetical protein VN803_05940, partial [Gemmatimonadales bacterium]|nr:hypothetical protein [Gemmatimonadales bacterium]